MEEKKVNDSSEEKNADSVEEPIGASGDSGPASVDSQKWQAALAYIPLVCLIPLFLNRDDPFIQRHARQGFILFMIILLAMLLKIDVIWHIIIAIAIAAAVVGALGILLRGDIKIPVLSELAEKLHI